MLACITYRGAAHYYKILECGMCPQVGLPRPAILWPWLSVLYVKYDTRHEFHQLADNPVRQAEWPDLDADAREILRVLKPRGTLILIAEAYKNAKYDLLLQKLEKLQPTMKYSLLSASENREMFSKAGYSDVRVFEKEEKGWICVVGKKIR